MEMYNIIIHSWGRGIISAGQSLKGFRSFKPYLFLLLKLWRKKPFRFIKSVFQIWIQTYSIIPGSVLDQKGS